MVVGRGESLKSAFISDASPITQGEPQTHVEGGSGLGGQQVREAGTPGGRTGSCTWGYKGSEKSNTSSDEDRDKTHFVGKSDWHQGSPSAALPSSSNALTMGSASWAVHASAALRTPLDVSPKKSDTNAEIAERVSCGEMAAFRSRERDNGLSITEACEAPLIATCFARLPLWKRDTAN